VIAAGGIYDGRGLAAMLMYGAQAVWVGTRFVAATEASAPKKHKELYVPLFSSPGPYSLSADKQRIVTAGHGDADRTLIYTGRPLRVRQTDYVKSWRGREEEM
jgi:NAD(P)H-dependent flavin oxidoreductase YrpB (nitropropane dioxygenase family)